MPVAMTRFVVMPMPVTLFVAMPVVAMGMLVTATAVTSAMIMAVVSMIGMLRAHGRNPPSSYARCKQPYHKCDDHEPTHSFERPRRSRAEAVCSKNCKKDSCDYADRYRGSDDEPPWPVDPNGERPMTNSTRLAHRTPFLTTVAQPGLASSETIGEKYDHGHAWF